MEENSYMHNGNVFGEPVRLPTPRPFQIDPSALAQILSLPEVARQQSRADIFEGLAGSIGGLLERKRLQEAQASKEARDLKKDILLLEKKQKFEAEESAKRAAQEEKLARLAISSGKYRKVTPKTLEENVVESLVSKKLKNDETFNQKEVDRFSKFGHRFEEIPKSRIGKILGKEFKYVGPDASTSIQSVENPPKLKYSQTATNPKTGDRIGLNPLTNKWEPIQ